MTKSIPYLKRNPNGTYYVHWTEDRIGKRVTTKTRDADRATRFLADWIYKSRIGADRDPSSDRQRRGKRRD